MEFCNKLAETHSWLTKFQLDYHYCHMITPILNCLCRASSRIHDVVWCPSVLDLSFLSWIVVLKTFVLVHRASFNHQNFAFVRLLRLCIIWSIRDSKCPWIISRYDSIVYNQLKKFYFEYHKSWDVELILHANKVLIHLEKFWWTEICFYIDKNRFYLLRKHDSTIYLFSSDVEVM
jgi:hypothetical protein